MEKEITLPLLIFTKIHIMKRFKVQLWIWLFLFLLMPYVLFLINTIANQRIIRMGEGVTEHVELLRFYHELQNQLHALDKVVVMTASDSVLKKSTYQNSAKQFENISRKIKDTVNSEMEKRLVRSIQKNFYLFQKELNINNKQSALVLLQDLQEEIDFSFVFYTQRIEERRTDFKSQSEKTLNVQENIGLAALFLMGIIGLIIIALFMRPLDRLTALLKLYYKSHLETYPRKKGVKELKTLESIIKGELEKNNEKEDAVS